MDTQKTVTFATVIFLVVLVSIFLGSAVGREDTLTAIIAVSVLVVVLLFVGLGEHIWVLVPVFASWSGRISLLPLPFSVSNLAVGFAVSAWFLAVASRKQKWNLKADSIDGVLLLTVMLIIIGYARNPVGVAAFTSGANVGARPYFEIGVAFIGYLMLANQKPKLSVVEKLPKWTLISAIVIGVGGTIAYFAPLTGIIMYQFYSGFMPNMTELLDPSAAAPQESIGRASFMRPIAFAGAAFVGACCCPLVVILPRRWGLLLLLGIASVAALVSGFRSAILAVGFYFVFASWLWIRGRGILACFMVAFLLLGSVIAIQQIVPLPDRVQRTLSFLPGNWDTRVSDDAANSIDWRLEMWETVLGGKSIKNWWIGDGFGFAKSELEYFGYLDRTNAATPEQMAEYYVITGATHSGPLSAAKYTGLVGMVLFVILAVIVAVRYVKIWNYITRYGESQRLQMVVGFFAITAAYIPLKFIFVYGAYDVDLPTLILSAGLLKVIETAVRDHVAEVEEEAEKMEALETVPVLA